MYVARNVGMVGRTFRSAIAKRAVAETFWLSLLLAGQNLSSPASLGIYFCYALVFILERMPRRLNNWSYREVVDFLKHNGFSFLKESLGSHQAWIKHGVANKPDIIVGVNFTNGSYLIKTLKRMIRESGIPQDEWIKWAGF